MTADQICTNVSTYLDHWSDESCSAENFSNLSYVWWIVDWSLQPISLHDLNLPFASILGAARVEHIKGGKGYIQDAQADILYQFEGLFRCIALFGSSVQVMADIAGPKIKT